MQQKYDRLARILHWVSAILFIGALAIGLYFSTLDYRNDDIDYAAFLKVIHWHKTFGILVFLLVFFRLYHRWKNPPPGVTTDSPIWMRIASRLSHFSLYGLMIILGASGLIASDIGNYAFLFLDVWPVPQFAAENRPVADQIFEIHMWLGNLAAWLVAVHVAATAYHRFILSDGIWDRMSFGKDLARKPEGK